MAKRRLHDRDSYMKDYYERARQRRLEHPDSVVDRPITLPKVHTDTDVQLDLEDYLWGLKLQASLPNNL